MRSNASCSASTRWCSKRAISVSSSTPVSATTSSVPIRAGTTDAGTLPRRFRRTRLCARSVDTVLCTHMHVDHVGWNTRLVDGRWEPTFPNARYLFAEKEWRHWSREPQEYGPVIEDSVQPIFDRGLADLVSETHRVTRRNRTGADAGPHARPRQRAHHLAWRRSGDHRRHDSSSVPDRAPALVEQRRCRSVRFGGDA